MGRQNEESKVPEDKGMVAKSLPSKVSDSTENKNKDKSKHESDSGAEEDS